MHVDIHVETWMGPRGYKKEPEAQVGSSFEITDSVESRVVLQLQAMKSKQSTPIQTQLHKIQWFQSCMMHYWRPLLPPETHDISSQRPWVTQNLFNNFVSCSFTNLLKQVNLKLLNVLEYVRCRSISTQRWFLHWRMFGRFV